MPVQNIVFYPEIMQYLLTSQVLFLFSKKHYSKIVGTELISGSFFKLLNASKCQRFLNRYM